MSTCVCVLSNNGERLMPTIRLGRVRRLLKDGKAKIIKHHPFTIQLLYDSKTNTQPIEICEDVGYNYIDISVKSESHEYVSAQYDTLQDEKEHHDDCRKYRRTRRNRLRYRKPRFDNRKRSEGWLAPSLEHKKQLNIRLIERYVSVIPITRATVEVGSFDTMLLQAIQKGESKPEGVDYQKGPRYNLATLREAVFYRDNYTCQVCGRKIADGAILHMHHMFYWKGRHGYQLVELVTACEKCHTPANHQKGGKLFGFGEDKEFANLSGAAFMNAVRWQIVNALYATYGNATGQIGCWLTVPETFGSTVLVYVQNLITGDVVTMKMYESNNYTAVATDVAQGRYKVVGTEVLEDGDYRFTVACEQDTLTTRDNEGFHLTISDAAHPDAKLVTPSRDNNSVVQEANTMNSNEETADSEEPADEATPVPSEAPVEEVKSNGPSIGTMMTVVVILVMLVVVGVVAVLWWKNQKQEE